ncbi:MAG: hypothetical protein IKQ59_04260 [Prevotella sp.]|jgi:hypothetical protein|nr:hypothetical protein [Prevotella sp.]
MSEERKFTEEELDAYLIERIGDFVTDYIDIMKYWEIYENKPMVERERQKYDNTISAIRDSLMFKRMTFRNAFGEKIYTALNDAFEKLFDAGEHQGKVISARQLKAMNVMTIEQIAEVTGLTAEEIEGL